jgi:hypothetical protein
MASSSGVVLVWGAAARWRALAAELWALGTAWWCRSTLH